MRRLQCGNGSAHGARTWRATRVEDAVTRACSWFKEGCQGPERRKNFSEFRGKARVLTLTCSSSAAMGPQNAIRSDSPTRIERVRPGLLGIGLRVGPLCVRGRRAVRSCGDCRCQKGVTERGSSFAPLLDRWRQCHSPEATILNSQTIFWHSAEDGRVYPD